MARNRVSRKAEGIELHFDLPDFFRHEIKRSHWVMWAERLQKLYNVHIVDARGQKWTPRLRARSEK